MTDTTNLGLHKPAAGDASWDTPLNQNADTLDAQFAATGTAHSHNGTAGKGPKLNQSATHETPDTDSAPTSLHHTLGTGANQAASGNHTHTGYAQTANNLSDLASAATARTNLGLGTAATHATGDYEPALGNPGTTGYVLASTTGGVRSWVAPGTGGTGGDASTNTATSVDGEVALFSGTAGKTLKRATGTGLALLTSGVQSTVTAPSGAVVGTTDTQTLTNKSIAASQVNSGTVATARLGSGTADATTYLRGDQTWATVSGGASAPSPASVTLVEEFIGGNSTSGGVGALGWLTNGATFLNALAAISNHPGILDVAGTGTSGTVTGVYLNTFGSHGTVIATDTFDLTFVFKLVSNDSNTTVRMGLGNAPMSDPPTNGIYIEKVYADTSFFGTARASASQSRTAALAATDTNWHKVRIRRTDASTIAYSIDGGTEATLTTNVPTGTLAPFFCIVNNAAAAKEAYLDYFQLTITTTR